MDKIAVVGAGLIGRAWALVFARAGHAVALYDADQKALQDSLPIIGESLGDLKRTGLIDEPPSTVRARIRAASTLDDALDGAVYVQENIRETLDEKREIFRRMDTVTLPETILAIDSCVSNVLYSGPEVHDEAHRKPRGIGTPTCSSAGVAQGRSVAR